MDPTLVLLVVITVMASGLAGFEICRSTHQQRGLGVDPWDYVVPDFPPADLRPRIPEDSRT